jgi:CRISPR-associated protein Csm4
LPRPALPGIYYDPVLDKDGQPIDRKAVKNRAWLPFDRLNEPVNIWLQYCRPACDIAGAAPTAHPQPHNSLHRLTGTTGGEGFAPFTMTQHWYGGHQGEPATLALHAVLDEDRLSADELRQALADMGQFGFGRDASIGLGKFDLLDMAAATLPAQAEADAWLTLAPCAPQGLGLDPERSYYQTFTRFGRHGDIGVHLGSPFKTPVLLAQTGAVLAAGPGMTPPTPERPWLGKGLGGTGRLTRNAALAGTVQQGYAPVVGLRLPGRTSA